MDGIPAHRPAAFEKIPAAVYKVFAGARNPVAAVSHHPVHLTLHAPPDAFAAASPEEIRHAGTDPDSGA
jgi:hypothetical protein